MSVITFLSSPLGLGVDREFTLDQVDDAGHLFSLRSVSNAATRLFLLRPQSFFAQYTPTMPADVLRELDIEEGHEDVFVVVHPGTDTQPATANLLAPILVNRTTHRGEQVVLEDSSWPLRAALQAT